MHVDESHKSNQPQLTLRIRVLCLRPVILLRWWARFFPAIKAYSWPAGSRRPREGCDCCVVLLISRSERFRLTDISRYQEPRIRYAGRPPHSAFNRKKKIYKNTSSGSVWWMIQRRQLRPEIANYQMRHSIFSHKSTRLMFLAVQHDIGGHVTLAGKYFDFLSVRQMLQVPSGGTY